jgi:hypothetical protein
MGAEGTGRLSNHRSQQVDSRCAGEDARKAAPRLSGVDCAALVAVIFRCAFATIFKFYM